MKLKEKADALKKDVPAVFIALKKKETPFCAKFFAFFTVAYALSPIDLIPDFIPILGYIDDLILLPLFVRITLKAIPKEILENCRKESEGMWENGRPKKWYYAIPIILFWLIIILIVLKIIFL